MLYILVGIHLMNKSDALLIKEEMLKLIDRYDCSTANEHTCYNWLEDLEVYVERVRVLSLFDMVVYDIDITEISNRGLQLFGFVGFFKHNTKYTKINCCGIKIDWNRSFSVVPLFYDGKLLVDLKEYGGSNIVHCEFRGNYSSGFGIYVDAENGRISVEFKGNAPQLVYGDNDLINYYNNSKFKGSMYLAVIGTGFDIYKMMPKICRKVSDNVYMLYNGAVLVGTYTNEDISNCDVVIPDGVTDVYFGSSYNKYNNINNYILPKSIKNIYKYKFFEAPRNLAFTFDKSISLSVLKEIAGLCGDGFILADNKEDLIKSLRSEGMAISLLGSEV